MKTPKATRGSVNFITPEYLARSGTEDGEQSALFCYAAEAGRADARWRLLYSIPNGGLRNPATAARMKATGAKKGFPDIGVPVPMGKFPGAFIEMKRAKVVSPVTGALIGGGSVETLQYWWHEELIRQGYLVFVCYGWLQAREVITRYFEGRYNEDYA